MKRIFGFGLAAVGMLALCSCGFMKRGTVVVRIPQEGLRSLASVSLVGTGAKPKTWTETNLTAAITNSLPPGDYQLRVGFANSNSQPPTEVAFGSVNIANKATSEISLGLMTFSVREGLPDLNLAEIQVAGREGKPTVALKNTGNTYYFFAPKPLPAGAYDVSILYSRSTGPSVVATGVVVNAGESTAVTLDTGFAMQPPRLGEAISGWSLTPEGKQTPWVSVKRGDDNEEPLWRRFIIPPGTYRVALFRDGKPPAEGPEDVTIEAGKTTEYSSIQ